MLTKNIHRPKSAWDHIYSLIRDGYISHAQAIIEAEEYQIDDAYEKLFEAQKEIEIIKAENVRLTLITEQWKSVAENLKNKLKNAKIDPIDYKEEFENIDRQDIN